MTALLVLAAFATSVLSGVFGMAGGLVLMGILAASLPVAAAMVLHGSTQLVANGSRAALLRRHVEVRGLVAFAIGALGAFALLRGLRWVPEPAVVLILLGAVPFVARLVPRGVWLDFSDRRVAVAAGFVVGAVQLLAGVAGPLLDVFFVDSKLDRRAVVATKAASQVFSHGLKLVYFAPLLADGALSPGLIGAASAAALAGTAVGGHLLDRMSDTSFRAATKWIVLGIGAFYLWRGVAALAAG